MASVLRDAGVGPADGYSESAVSNWIKGRTRPPADVVLAAASLDILTLDVPLGLPGSGSDIEWYAKEELQQLRSALAQSMPALRELERASALTRQGALIDLGLVDDAADAVAAWRRGPRW